MRAFLAGIAIMVVLAAAGVLIYERAALDAGQGFISQRHVHPPEHGG
ncbi:hypothetical protein [Thalassobaculum sp.]